MIESIEFENFKALRNTKLRLAPFTILLGPNGSGKSSVLQALQGIAGIVRTFQRDLERGSNISGVSAPWTATPCALGADLPVQIKLEFSEVDVVGRMTFDWSPSQELRIEQQFQRRDGKTLQVPIAGIPARWLARMQTYSLDPVAIANHVAVNAAPLGWNGSGLPAVLDDIKDNYPERWESLLKELRVWLPEFDHIQFVKPQDGHKSIALRTKRGNHTIRASELSQGSLVALALLTLAYLPNPPSLIGLEEIDRGLHPRLLRHLQDALYRLSYPEACGEKRPPIQVIATTHSPYLLDLYRDHPEEVVLAQKEGLEVQFKQLSQVEHFKEILGDAPLSEVWYSGVLGGVSVKP